MIVDLAPRFLTWADVDPARHPFDSASVAQTVRSLGPARCVPIRPDVPAADSGSRRSEEAESWADAMSYALVLHYGRWTLGWRWAHDEGDFDGGPVGSWCCPQDSITTPEETLARVEAALREWREWLEHLDAWFEAYPLDLSAIEDQRILWERAARNLILQVVDRTGCGSGWHNHCRQVLAWFLDRWGVAVEVAQGLVEEAVGGRLHSWTGPDMLVIDDVAEHLARSLQPGDGGTRAAVQVQDHLQRWLAIRASVPWHEIPDAGADGPVAAFRDGPAEDIRAFDGAIDPARAEGLLRALEVLRADAARGARLDFALLSTWHQHVLGSPQPPPFRTSPAFAKGGRERYGLGPDTPARFDTSLAESAATAGEPLGLTARAARTYLDVCFFHPFDDGNARSAFLALVFVLAREGVALGAVGLLRRVTFEADHPQDPLALIRYLNIHLAETRGSATDPTVSAPG
ncbi:Fic family protein [[Kitasatospora] papulosa]|uniref:Fic family protein n=1 Tax=Streptomyces TaxID=1883 RepID=UPI0034372F34